MNLIDIRSQISLHLEFKDLIHFLSIDHMALEMDNYVLWKNIANHMNIQDENIKTIKIKLKHDDDTNKKVKMIIYKTLNEKINIINIISSFTYLKKVIMDSNLLKNYHCEEENQLDNIIKYYELDAKYLKELYVYTCDGTYNLEFVVPKIYNISLKSYTWYGITLDEIKQFLFNFFFNC